MKRGLLVLLFTLSFAVNLLAQDPEKNLAVLKETSPIQKIYVHTDRDVYLAGETLWFKSYFYADFLPDDSPTTLYFELVDEQAKSISRKIYPVFNSFARGQLELPDSIKTGYYFLEAFAHPGKKTTPSALYRKKIFVTGQQPRTTKPIEKDTRILIDFFPEGGNMVHNQPSTIAFKATRNGYPVTVSGVVKNSKDEMIKEFTSFHDGMGIFEVIGDFNDSYYIQLIDDPSGQKYFLPKSIEKGATFRLLSSGKQLYYELRNQEGDPNFTGAYLIGQMQHHVVLKQNFSQGQSIISGTIKTTELPSGILHLTVFNKNNLPIAERLTFIDNKEYLQAAVLNMDTLSVSARGFNKLGLNFPDSVTGSFSLSITDAEFVGGSARDNNIISEFLLNSDLKGYIYQPYWYFTPNDSAAKGLDLLMLTNGWRRFRWDKINSEKGIVEKPAGYIRLQGEIKGRNNNKPLVNKNVVLFIVSGDSTRSMEYIETDSKGRFVVDSLVFFERSRMFFSAVGSDTKLNTTFSNEDSLGSIKILRNNLADYAIASPIQTSFNLNNRLAKDFEDYKQFQGKNLQEVIVKAKKKTREEIIEERYANLFSGSSGKTIDLTETKETVPYSNIFEYLKSRVPGLNVNRNGNNYVLNYRNKMSVTGGMSKMDIYLNEILTDAGVIATIPAREVAMVKVFDTYVAGAGNSPGGALVIYTKKGEDLYALEDNGQQLYYQGYSISKEFYSPDYKNPADQPAGGNDRRITLLWVPDIIISGKNEKVPVRFFNNDRTKFYKVIVEGVTSEGKLLMMEKIINK